MRSFLLRWRRRSVRAAEELAQGEVQPPALHVGDEAVEVLLRQADPLAEPALRLLEDGLPRGLQPARDRGLTGLEECGQLRLRQPVPVVELEQLALLVRPIR